LDELVQETQDSLSRRWCARSIRTFVDGVHDYVLWALLGNCEHVFEALHKHVIAGLLGATTVLIIQAGKDFATKIGPSGQLEKK